MKKQEIKELELKLLKEINTKEFYEKYDIEGLVWINETDYDKAMRWIDETERKYPKIFVFEEIYDEFIKRYNLMDGDEIVEYIKEKELDLYEIQTLFKDLNLPLNEDDWTDKYIITETGKLENFKEKELIYHLAETIKYILTTKGDE